MNLLSSHLETPSQIAIVLGSLFSLGLLSSSALSQSTAQTSSGIVNRYTVNNTNDSGAGSLRQAVLNANASPGADEIVFNLPGSGMKTITITSGQIEIADQLTISGSGRDQLTISKNNSSRRLLRVNLGANVTLKGVTIANSQNTAGSTIGNFGKLSIQDSAFRNNSGQDGGTIVNGGAKDSATAITLNLNNVEFSNNIGITGGAINNFATANISGCTFNSNTSSLGGAIYNQGSGTLRIGGAILTQNRASTGGGIANDGELTILNGRFLSNTAFSQGGGIFNRGTARIRGSVFQTNRAAEEPNSTPNGPNPQSVQPLTPAAVRSTTSSLKESNTPMTIGGGIFNSSTLTLDSSTLENNQANIGGGIFNSYEGIAQVGATTIHQNTANESPDASGTFCMLGKNQIDDPTGSTGLEDGSRSGASQCKRL